jgi:hypothetical protein
MPSKIYHLQHQRQRRPLPHNHLCLHRHHWRCRSWAQLAPFSSSHVPRCFQVAPNKEESTPQSHDLAVISKPISEDSRRQIAVLVLSSQSPPQQLPSAHGPAMREHHFVSNNRHTHTAIFPQRDPPPRHVK